MTFAHDCAILSSHMVADNLKNVTRRIATCCEKSGRGLEEILLVSVTKDASVEAAREALDAGERNLGENRIQGALEKYGAIGDSAIWHLIGHLQTNKARDAVRIFSLIHSVDSIRLAQAIDKEAAKIGKVQDILIQVNVAGEVAKFGIRPSEAEGLIKAIAAYPNIRAQGLMTIGPIVDDPEKARPHFRALRELRDDLNRKNAAGYNLRHLSMGMTDDFEVAIEELSTIVRIGRAIFGDKHDK